MFRILCLACLLAPTLAIGQLTDSLALKYAVNPVRTTETMVVDGVLNEAIWQQGKPLTGFRRNFPEDSTDLKGQSQVWVAYDNDYLYIAAINQMSTDKSYVIQNLKRDFQRYEVDFFAVFLNPSTDQTNGFYFAVSPYGVQAEGLISNSNDISLNWDNKWFTETVRGERVWTVEMAIPFKSLRYSADSKQWRINFGRADRQADNEVGSWVPVPRNQNIDNILFTGSLTWPEPLPKPGRNIAIIPYVGGQFVRDYEDDVPWDNKQRIGLDAKIAVSPSLNLDLTVNPDFSNVEADVQQINITRFALFFPERRQFFLENSDLFSSFGFGNARPFFSRRVGLGIPIVAGARLSGKVGEDWRVGLMTVQTEGKGEDDLSAKNFTVAAVQRQVFKASNIGLIFVNQQEYDDVAKRFRKENYNRVAGIDFNFQNADASWDSKAFFQRSFDPSDGGNPIAYGFVINKSKPNGSLTMYTEYMNKDFRAETGFTPRQYQYDPATDSSYSLTYRRVGFEAQYNFLPKDKAVAFHGPGFNVEQIADSAGRPTDYSANGYWFLQFRNSMNVSAYINHNYTRLQFPFGISSSETALNLPVASYRYDDGGVEFSSDRRKPFRYYASVGGGKFFNGTAVSAEGGISYRAQPWGNFSLDVEYNKLGLPAEFGGDETFVLVGSRTDLSFSRSLFFTTFLQYNSQADNTNVNTRMQWRFAPMSDVFFVYIDNYDPMFNIKNRQIVLKFVYWLGV